MRKCKTNPVGVGAAYQLSTFMGRTISIVNAHHDDGKRFVVRADQKLTAFVELQAAIHRRLRLSWKVTRRSTFC
jgi:hypothetical protein